MSIRTFLVQPHPLHRTSCVLLWRFIHSTMESSDHQAATRNFCYLSIPQKCSFIPLAVSSSMSRLHPQGAVIAEACETSDDFFGLNSHSNSQYSEAGGEVEGVACPFSEPAITCNTEELKETLRRRRIGLANKGKVPWNKGRKHSPETCARIKEKTLEALKDPKVRRKMSESPRTHSEQTKKKIGSSLKKKWAERLKHKRSKEMFCSSWAESIAEAARTGGIDEQQLEWNSYEMLKVEIAFQKLQRDKEKSKEKETKRIRAETKRIRAEKIARERECKRSAKLRAKKKERTSCKKRKVKDGQTASRELNITDRLTKNLGNKSIDGPSSAGVMIGLQSALENFDIESIKAEQKRNTVSLADQIKAAKSKRQSVSSGSTIAQ